jgi:hypothetical protein
VKADLCYGFSSTDWVKLFPKLDNDENAWLQAIDVFERRMKERFFSCLDALVQADTKPDLQSDALGTDHCIPGFSVMALCCLLIETLQGFREPSTPFSPPGPCEFPAGLCIKPSSGTNEQFRKFLRLPSFGGAFNNKDVANEFLRGVRNGILHEGETRKWVIWRQEPQEQIVAPEQDGYALNRYLFYGAVKQEFESYLKDLRNPESKQRQRFREQMQKLCNET